MLLNPKPSKSAKCHIRENFGKYEKTSVVILQEREVQESLACSSAQAAGTGAHTGHAELAWCV